MDILYIIKKDVEERIYVILFNKSELHIDISTLSTMPFTMFELYFSLIDLPDSLAQSRLCIQVHIDVYKRSYDRYD